MHVIYENIHKRVFCYTLNDSYTATYNEVSGKFKFNSRSKCSTHSATYDCNPWTARPCVSALRFSAGIHQLIKCMVAYIPPKWKKPRLPVL